MFSNIKTLDVVKTNKCNKITVAQNFIPGFSMEFIKTV